MKTNLSNKEAIALLRTRLKPYNFVGIAQSVFSANIIKIENDMIKPKTAQEFLAKFGFTGSWNNWELDFDNWKLEAK